MMQRASVNCAELTLGQGWQPSWWPVAWKGKAVKEESRDGSSLRALEWKASCTRRRVATNLFLQGKCPIHGEPTHVSNVLLDSGDTAQPIESESNGPDCQQEQ
jgi:hypothetical protein